MADLEEYGSAEEAVDALIQLESVLEVLIDRPQPAFIRTLLIAGLRRAQSVTERHSDWTTLH